MPDRDKVIAGKNGLAKRVTCPRNPGRFLMRESSPCTAYGGCTTNLPARGIAGS